MPKLRGSGRIASMGAVSLVLSFLSPVAAQTNPDQLARRHFETGAAYFEQAEYESALREFEKSYELSKRTPILRNISIVHERLGNWCEAVESLDQFLLISVEDENSKELRERRDSLRKRWESSGKACQDGDATELSESPRPLAEPDTPDDKQAPAQAASSDSAAVSSDSAAVSSDSTAASSDSAAVSSDSTKGEKVRDTTREVPTMQPDRTWATVSLIAGGVAGLAAIGLGAAASSEHDNLSGSCSPRCSESQTSGGETLALSADVLFGLSAVGIGLGAWLWFTGTPDSTERAPQVSFFATPKSAYASALWSF